MALTIHWPQQVSALQPVPIEVELIPPPGVSVTATIRAIVMGPQGSPRRVFDLTPRQGNVYAADDLLRLPLQPSEGDWRLLVYVRSELDVEGERQLTFQPSPVSFRDLVAVLPPGVDVRVPQDFDEVVFQGDQWAGGRVWRYEDGELSLWWAPGPTESLQRNNAVVMLEATYDLGVSPRVGRVDVVKWQDQPGFLFHEEWAGPDGGPAEALVVQGPDYWLYVLRVRARGAEAIPSLMHQVWRTFTLVEEQE